MIKYYHPINLVLVALIIVGIAFRYTNNEVGNLLFLSGTLIGYFYKTRVITYLQKELVNRNIIYSSSILMKNQLWINILLLVIILGGLVLIFQSKTEEGIKICSLGLFISFAFKSWLIEQYQNVLPKS